MGIVRGVLALVLAAPFFLLSSVAPVVGTQRCYFHVVMRAPDRTLAQVFFDRGQGFRWEDSALLEVGPARATYNFPIPLGPVKALRFDPGLEGGTYELLLAEIRAADGRLLAPLPLTGLQLNQLRAEGSGANPLQLVAPAGSQDPFVVFRLQGPLNLAPIPYSIRGLWFQLFAWWAGALVLVVMVEWSTGRSGAAIAGWLRRTWTRAAAAPARSVVVVMVLATTVATYPVLLANRSLVSPAAGHVQMLYDGLPLAPGSRHYTLEDTRNSDVGAAMWAFVPYSSVQRDAVRHGEWPLWIRQNGSGRPLWGQGQGFMLDPLHWLTLIAPDLAWGWDLKFVAHRLLFSIGIAWASWLASGSLGAALLAGAAAPFCGLYSFRFNHPAAFTPTYAAWVLVFWFLLVAAETRAARAKASLLLAAASSLTLVSSPPKEAVVMLAGMHLIGLLSVATARISTQARLTILMAAATAGVIAILLTAPHWLVFLETLRQSSTLYDVPAVNLATTESLVGFVLGNLTPMSLEPGVHPLAAILALVALCAPVVWFRRRVLGACAAGTWLLAALAYGLIPAEWLVQVPFVQNISHLGNTLMTAMIVPVLVLAAGGVCALLDSGVLVRLLLSTGTAAGCVALLASKGLGLQTFHAWLLIVVGMVLSAVPWLMPTFRRLPESTLAAVCSASVVCALLAPFGLQLPTNFAALDALLPQPPDRIVLDENSEAIDQVRLLQATPFRAIGIDNVLFPGSQALYELEGIGGPDALELKPYEALLDAGGVTRQWGWRTLIPSDAVTRTSTLLDVLNVGLMVTKQGTVLPGLPPSPPDPDQWIDITTRGSAWPRAFFVDGVRSARTATEFLALAAAAGHPIGAIQPDDPEAAAGTIGLPSQERTIIAAEQYRLRTNLSRFRVRSNGPGLAVLTESYMAHDFRAWLNGVRVPYFRVNQAFKAVRIPGEGTWEITFDYSPASWAESWMLAGVGVVLATGMARIAALGQRAASAPRPTAKAADERS